MKKLNFKGIAHWIFPVIVVLVVGGIGSFMLSKSRAASAYTYSSSNMYLKPSTIKKGATTYAYATVVNTGKITLSNKIANPSISIYDSRGRYVTFYALRYSTNWTIRPGGLRVFKIPVPSTRLKSDKTYKLKFSMGGVSYGGGNYYKVTGNKPYRWLKVL